MKFDSPSNQAWGIVKDDFIRWDRRVNSSNFSFSTPSIIKSNVIYNYFISFCFSKEIHVSKNRSVFTFFLEIVRIE